MKKYELMAIIVNNVDEKVASDIAKTSILDRVAEFGGKTTFEDFWGARGFAYKINGEKWGYYFVCQFDIEGSNIAKLERELNIDNQVVRFLVTSVEADAEAPEKYETLQARAEAARVEKEKKNAPKEEAKPEKKEEKKADALKKDEVDKKLDKIMDDASSTL